MRPYGSENWPAALSSLCYGDDHTCKASLRNLGRNAEGDLHNTFRNINAKRAARRGIKRMARRAGKAACRELD